MADADANSMNSSALLYQAVMMLLLCIIFIVVWTRGCKRDTLLDYRTPLLEEDTHEHRIDAATREAEEGYALCTACSFENFKRFAHCTICGENLGTSEDGAGEVSAVTPSLARRMNARQLRARKRKEWTRVLNEDGEMRWARNAMEDQYDLAPAFVATFPKSPRKDAAVDGIETIHDLLLHEVAGHSPVLLEAFEANAASFPTGYEFDSDRDRRNEIVRLSALDFPSKYAHFVVATSTHAIPAEIEFLKLSLHRDYVLEESVDHLCCIQEKHIKSVMRINFLDESAVDAGGVHREWIMLVNQLLVDSPLHLFVCHNRVDQSYHINPNSRQDVGDDHLKYYFATGRLIGRVLLEGGVWGFHLSIPLLKIILGRPVSLGDLEYFDPEVFRTLTWLLENDGVESLGLDFSVCEQANDGETRIVDLIPNGRDIAVSDANKTLYVERKLKYLLVESVGEQLHALLKGIYEVIPQDLLMLYDVEEFDYLLCGTDEVDVDDWEKHTTHSLNLEGTRAMGWFWEEVRGMPNELRRRLLLFATGSSRVPLAGFKGLTSYDGRLCPFTLKGVSRRTDKYITSHACFNRLDLPLYKSREELRTVLYAILQGDVLGFTTA